MKKSEITFIVKRIMKKEFPQIKFVKLTDNLIDGGLDSITTIELIVKIEERFGFEFYDEDLLMSNFATLRAMIDYIAKRLTEKNDIVSQEE